MSHYAITVAPDEAGREFQVVLRGPGIDSGGRRYVFATTYRCKAFVEAVNFAYEQGLRDGRREAECRDEQFFLVTGTTPENLILRAESWWSRWKRRLRSRRSFRAWM